ncbi:hypothetical pox protein [Squirrelpox virus]|uniref:beta-galactoside alpha-(2,6)-sialyltransferase n=1 Tax=Squirrelpox virus TaxID=240426 RepID=Q1HTP7_9POXV|nr:hypothetical pox protein [Squirrelpox virus]ABD51489.1 C16R [Squirrelpox virus]CCD83321.1 hypothetical pox protein [Squirrelpox virus]
MQSTGRLARTGAVICLALAAVALLTTWLLSSRPPPLPAPSRTAPRWTETRGSSALPARLLKDMRWYLETNTYNVTADALAAHAPGSASLADARCALDAATRALSVGSADLRRADLKSMPALASILPSLGLAAPASPRWRRCAIVASAGALSGSGLGPEIESHDAVVRMNAAPTRGYEADVGSRTTVRVTNSKMVAGDPRLFARLAREADLTLVWDPYSYGCETARCLASPEFDFAWQIGRMRLDGRRVQLADPQLPWRVWGVLQSVARERIHPHPPSSGMLGIAVGLALCDRVTVYGFIPSRPSPRCYYWSSAVDVACSLGSYHPLLFEKNLVHDLHEGTDEDLRRGVVRLRGHAATRDRCAHVEK